MKTSLLISSLAALCLLVTFAESPRRHGEDKMNFSSTDNTSVVPLNRATMLPGVVITSDRTKEAAISEPLIPASDFSYLKFDAVEYLETDAVNLDEAEVLPEAVEDDFSDLKFNVSDFSTGTELAADGIEELPVNETSNTNISIPEPALNEFEYLRFDVNDYINGAEVEGYGDLPLEEDKTSDQSELAVPGVIKIDFGYLKFNVAKYYIPGNLSSDEQFELPEE
jgi:hypothetical protein